MMVSTKKLATRMVLLMHDSILQFMENETPKDGKIIAKFLNDEVK